MRVEDPLLATDYVSVDADHGIRGVSWYRGRGERLVRSVDARPRQAGRGRPSLLHLL